MRYRYGGYRYSLRGPSKYLSNQIIPQDVGLYGFPSGDIQGDGFAIDRRYTTSTTTRIRGKPVQNPFRMLDFK